MRTSTLNSSLSIIPIILLFLLIMILLYVKHLNDRKDFIESFYNNNGLVDGYLYPTTGLSDECSKEGLKPAFMPKVCDINGNLDVYSNCKCTNDKGDCKLCYPKIKRDVTNAEPVYEVGKYQDRPVQHYLS